MKWPLVTLQINRSSYNQTKHNLEADLQNSDEEWTLSLDPDDDEQQITQPHLTDRASLSNICFKKMTTLVRETLPKTGCEDRENGKYNLVYHTTYS